MSARIDSGGRNVLMSRSSTHHDFTFTQPQQQRQHRAQVSTQHRTGSQPQNHLRCDLSLNGARPLQENSQQFPRKRVRLDAGSHGTYERPPEVSASIFKRRLNAGHSHDGQGVAKRARLVWCAKFLNHRRSFF